jgi:LysM repeat protein
VSAAPSGPRATSAPTADATSAPSASVPSAVPSILSPAPVGASATPRTYTVRAGDSLSAIAERFGLTIGQLLNANPDVTDPDRIEAGDVLVIPPPDAPGGAPRSGRLLDVTGDVLDAEDLPTFAPGYVDLAALGARVDPDVLIVEIRGVAAPPETDPEVEEVTYTLHLDVTNDAEPDVRLAFGNRVDPRTGTYAPAFTDLVTGQTRTGASAFPGVVEIDEPHVRFQVDRAALGAARRFAIAASIERHFYPGGREDPDVETAIDKIPDQQWPRPNPRWLEVGIGR